jgi:hypothetical protein
MEQRRRGGVKEGSREGVEEGRSGGGKEWRREGVEEGRSGGGKEQGEKNNPCHPSIHLKSAIKIVPSQKQSTIKSKI